MGKYQKNIEAARRITVMQYLETYHPGELVRKTDREYCTRTHDSLIITPANGFFHWFSRNVGGNNAIDYLTKVEGMDFVSAVRLLNEMAPVAASFQPAKAAPVKPHEPRPFTLPTPDRNVEAVAAYLMHRGISPKVLRYCVGSGILYQTTRGNYRNCVFVGKDEGGVPRCTRVGESLTKSESVLRYSKQCPASVAYRALAKEVEKGERSREKHPTALDR